MITAPRPSITLVSDDLDRSRRLSGLLSQRFHVEAARIEEFAPTAHGDFTYVVDANLSDPRTISRIKEKVTGTLKGRDKYFVIDDSSRTDLVQANSLGARDVIRRSFIARDAALLINKLNERLVGDLWRDQPADIRLALTSINVLNDNLYTAVTTGSPLPKTQAADCCEYLISTLEDETLERWLNAVRQHHSYTYRHSMIVSGLAVFFALRLGMRRDDVERIAIGALMHDVGKMRMPLGLLDKPGALSETERAEITKHPVLGAKILRADRQFSDEVIDISHHHHEFLDGSGYPDGLEGEEISDPVRIMTIVDIFAALIDERSYKPPMPYDQAYRILTEMTGKVDGDILRAFEPIALNAAGAEQGIPSYAATV